MAKEFESTEAGEHWVDAWTAPGTHHPSELRRRARPRELVAVAVGGALGAPARYGVSQLIHVAPGSYPWATFAINVSGSFALGLVLGVVAERVPSSHWVRPFVATGFLGAYTTYSTFAVESVLLVKDGHVAVAAVYAAASLVAGFAAVWAGARTATRLGGAT